jgi:Ser/Thr protein kinase RdoA (MazF antagonist)
VEPPGEILDAAGIEPADVSLLPWRLPIWRVIRDGVVAILRRSRIDALFSLEDLRWQHRIQLLLADRGLPVPMPMPVFDGETATGWEGWAWEVLRYLPGCPLAWQARPALREVGGLMARFHAASADLVFVGQRPNVVPLCGLSAMANVDVIDASLPDAPSKFLFRRHLAEVEDRLADLGQSARRPALVHGDLTTLNVLVDGSPARVSGLIDFNNAYLEMPLADVGFSLWQAGRPAHDDYTLDPRRVRGLVSGYAEQRRLPRSTGHEIATFIRARGIQLMVRSSLRGPRDLRLPLQLVDWVADHQTAIAVSVSDTLGGRT